MSIREIAVTVFMIVPYVLPIAVGNLLDLTGETVRSFGQWAAGHGWENPMRNTYKFWNK